MERFCISGSPGHLFPQPQTWRIRHQHILIGSRKRVEPRAYLRSSDLTIALWTHVLLVTLCSPASLTLIVTSALPFWLGLSIVSNTALVSVCIVRQTLGLGHSVAGETPSRASCITSGKMRNVCTVTMSVLLEWTGRAELPCHTLHAQWQHDETQVKASCQLLQRLSTFRQRISRLCSCLKNPTQTSVSQHEKFPSSHRSPRTSVSQYKQLPPDLLPPRMSVSKHEHFPSGPLPPVKARRHLLEPYVPISLDPMAALILNSHIYSRPAVLDAVVL